MLVPGVEPDAARDLVRVREGCRGSLTQVWRWISKLLLRHGTVYTGGDAPTAAHNAWPARQHVDKAGDTHARRLLGEASWRRCPQ